MDTYVIWAGILGALSAVSLLIGSLIGVTARLPRTAVGLLAAFGAGGPFVVGSVAVEVQHHDLSRAFRARKIVQLHSLVARDLLTHLLTHRPQR